LRKLHDERNAFQQICAVIALIYTVNFSVQTCGRKVTRRNTKCVSLNGIWIDVLVAGVLRSAGRPANPFVSVITTSTSNASADVWEYTFA
jgi:hypothetical protein